jgi:hypothetical protein
MASHNVYLLQVTATGITTFGWTALLGEEAAGDVIRVRFPKVNIARL